MTVKTINVIKDFYPAPYGRYSRDVQPGETDASGERFREEYLIPALRENDKVIVDLTGYNRYARSFLDEAFAGLISSGEFTLADLRQKLEYRHENLPSIVALIESRMAYAEDMRAAH